MKLIEDARAPNPRRVRIFLAEKDVEVASEPVAIMSLEHKSGAIAALNPLALLPILELEDGTAISESVAICRYFEAIHPDPPLMGEGPVGCALVEMWQRRVEHGFLFPVAQAVRHLHPRFDILEKPQVSEWGEVSKQRVPGAIKILDEQLAGSRYIAGDDFTIADITAIVATEFMRVGRIEIPSEAKHFARWWGNVSARPSVTRKS